MSDLGWRRQTNAPAPRIGRGAQAVPLTGLAALGDAIGDYGQMIARAETASALAAGRRVMIEQFSGIEADLAGDAEPNEMTRRYEKRAEAVRAAVFSSDPKM